MSKQSEQAKAIFLEALDKHAPDEWPSFLEQACAGDAALRADVEELLRARAEIGSFHEQPRPAVGPTVDQPLSEHPGTVIGPYKLLEPLGEGGMGQVFIAEQQAPVRRKVALKLIKPGLDSARVIARFEQERQALAMMDHPNIAKVLDAGTTVQGRPYFVMELVKGVPITKFCDHEHLSCRERLELFIPVCQAVQHAHQKGIIHRDLKPSNVLIGLYDGRPVPKVIDFGVAKATGGHLSAGTLHTEAGSIVGTLEYMAPEQAELNNLDIDTRADIYSLGVLLYELLTGSPPFTREQLRSAAFDEMLRMIREVEPPKPSTRLSNSDELPSIAAARKLEPAGLSRLVTGELDWIVMKCLAKERHGRYETASGLALDIGRFLADEPVLAGPPSAAYRMKKFVRRNKGPLLAASLLVLALGGGFIGTALGLVEARRQRDAATAAAVAEKQAKETAETREAETKAVLEFVENKVFAAARPEGQEGGLGHDVTLRQAVEAALPFVENGFSNQPLIEARLRMTLGVSFAYLGEAGKAEEHFQKAHRLTANQLGPDHPATFASMNNMANCYEALGRLDEALTLRKESLALEKATLGAEHPDTLASMVNLAISYGALGRYADAVGLCEAALPVMKRNMPDHPFTFNCMNNLAADYLALGRHAEALKLSEETLALWKANLGPDHPDTLHSMNNLAESYQALGRLVEALKLHEETLALRNAKLGPDHPDTFASMNNLAASFEALGRLDEALKLREETLTLRKTKLGPDHPDTLASMNNLAASFEALGRLDEALKLNEETLALRKTKLGPDHPDTLHSMNNLALSYQALGRHADSVKLFEETLTPLNAKLGAEHPDTLTCMNNLANSYRALGRHADALTLSEETLALRKANLGPEHPDTLASMVNLAISYGALGRYADAVGLCEAALPVMKRNMPDHPFTFNCMNNLAADYLALGRHAEALKLNEETLAIKKAKLGPDHPDTLGSMNNLAAGYHAVGRHADALKLSEETLVLRKAKLGADHPDTLVSMWGVAMSLAALDRAAEALPIVDECLRLAAGKVVHPGLIPGLMDVRLRHFAKINDAAGCRATAEMWEGLKRSDAGSLYNAACFRAVTAAVIRAGDESEDGAKQAAAEADRAMDWLKQAVAAGFKDAAHMKQDTDLEALRTREDFKQLIAELEAGR